MPQAQDARALAAARQAVAGLRAWIVTDGKAGDEVQCIGVAERLGLSFELRHISPRAPFALLMPWGPPDPREAPGAPRSLLAPPWPDIAIASGRRSVTYLRALKKASDGQIFTAFLKDPRVGTRAADFIWLPEHDSLRGPNVLTTLTSPHRIAPERLAAARAAPPAPIAALAPPRVALLLGGDSKDFRFGEADIRRLAGAVSQLAARGAAVMVTASRRTPPALADAVRLATGPQGWFWDGTGDNPYVAMLANADAIVVTADSVNMLGEAAATGKPVLLFTPAGGSDKIHRFVRGLTAYGAVRPFTGELESFTYEPLDATPTIAIALAAAFERFRGRR